MLNRALKPAEPAAAPQTTGNGIGWAVEQLEAGRTVRIASDPGLHFTLAKVPAARIKVLLGVVQREADDPLATQDPDGPLEDQDVLHIHQLDVVRYILSTDWELAP